MTTDNRHVFSGLEPPQPPAELHDRVMRETVEALGREARPDLWTRIWESRVARLAWAGAVACLLLGHLALTLSPDAGSPQPGFPLAAAATEMDDELAAIADLPALNLDAQPRGDAGNALEAADIESDNDLNDKEMS